MLAGVLEDKYQVLERKLSMASRCQRSCRCWFFFWVVVVEGGKGCAAGDGGVRGELKAGGATAGSWGGRRASTWLENFKPWKEGTDMVGREVGVFIGRVMSVPHLALNFNRVNSLDPNPILNRYNPMTCRFNEDRVHVRQDWVDPKYEIKSNGHHISSLD